MIILKVLLIILLAIIMLMFFSLFIKVKYSLYSIIDNDDININASFTVLLGIFRVQFLRENGKFDFYICLFGKKLKIKPYKKDDSKRKKSQKKKRKKKIKWNTILRQLIKYFKEILDIMKPKIFEVKGVYGFYDPSVTGIMCGIIPIIKEIVPSADIELNPVFEEEDFDVKIRILGDALPIVVLVKTLKLIFSKDVRKIIFSKA